MKILAGSVLFLATIRAVGAPFMIGQKRKDYNANDCFASQVSLAMLAALCGRILGWW